MKAPELCSRQDFGAKVWNSSHYVVIEAMRKQLHEASCLPGKAVGVCMHPTKQRVCDPFQH